MILKDFITHKYFVRDGAMFTTRRGNTIVTPNKIRSDYELNYPIKARDYGLVDIEKTSTEIIKTKTARLKSLRSSLARDETGYIMGVLSDEGITADKRWKVFKYPLASGNSKDLTSADIEIILKGRLSEYNRGVGDSGFPIFKKEPVMDRFQYLCANMTTTSISSQQIDIKHDSDCIPILDQWVDDLIKVMYITTKIEISRVVIKHMMWQVKRRFFGREVKNDLWTAFQGGQGKGKTYMMRNCIFLILSEFYCETQLSKIDDLDREVRKFSDNFIVNFEELALGNTGIDQHSGQRLNKKTINNLKSILTSDELYIRQMGGQTQLRVGKTFVPISTANERLPDVIHDTTGMRRFFELTIDCPPDIPTFDVIEVARLAKLSKDAWRGIDENSPKPIWDWKSDVGKEIAEIQSTYRPTTNIDQWIIDSHYVKDESIEISATVLYKDYKEYAKETGCMPFGFAGFRDQMALMFTAYKRSGRGDYYRINKKIFVEGEDDSDAPKTNTLNTTKPSAQMVANSKDLI